MAIHAQHRQLVSATRAFVNGQPADAAALVRFARMGYTHYTTMQVRAGAVRGLNLHLARLHAATQHLFDVALDIDVLRLQMRAALHGMTDASLRISVGAANYTARVMPSPARVEVLMLVDPPAPAPVAPVRLMSAEHVRYLPQVKHAGSFDVFHLRRRAHAAGFDDALLITPDGCVAEGATFNVGFFAGQSLLWPQAAQLQGVTMRLLSKAWAQESHAPGFFPGHEGATVRHRPVRLDEVAGLDGGFCCHAGGIWPILGIDGIALPQTHRQLERLERLYLSVTAEAI